jgi:hypothetical protein
LIAFFIVFLSALFLALQSIHCMQPSLSICKLICQHYLLKKHQVRLSLHHFIQIATIHNTFIGKEMFQILEATSMMDFTAGVNDCNMIFGFCWLGAQDSPPIDDFTFFSVSTPSQATIECVCAIVSWISVIVSSALRLHVAHFDGWRVFPLVPMTTLTSLSDDAFAM